MSERLDDLKRLGKLWEQLGGGREIAWFDSTVSLTATVFAMPLRSSVDSPPLDATPCIAILQNVFGETAWINRHSDDKYYASLRHVPYDYIAHSGATPIQATIAALEAEVERRKMVKELSE